MSAPDVSLKPADYIVAIVILLVPVAIGILFAVKDAHKATRLEYLLGGRKMSALPVGMSLFVTFFSAISVMGVPAEVYFYGFIYILLNLGLVLKYGVGTMVVVPLLYPLKITSVFEYLQLRYKSEAVRMFGTVISILNITFYMSIALLSPALALEACANVPLWLSITVMGSVGTIYTAIGGIKSVIWTDAFQTVVICVGLFIICVKTCLQLGGLGEVWNLSQKGGRIQLDRFTPDPRVRHSVWGMVFGLGFSWFTNTFHQATIQRISCMKSMQEAKRAYAFAGGFVLLVYTMLCLLGLIIYAYFVTIGCDPEKAGYISNRNQIAPYFVLHAMGDLPGMAGLIISVLCCGSLSTLSSGINALATLTVEDVLRRPLKRFNEKTITSITKALVLVYGAVIIGLTYFSKSLKGNLNQLTNTASGVLKSPLLGMFLLGAILPRANKYGAFVGAALSFIFTMWINTGNQMLDKEIPVLLSIDSRDCANESSPSGLESSFYTPSSVFNSSRDTNYVNYSIITTNKPETEMAVTSDGGLFFFEISYEWYAMLGTFVCVIVGMVVSVFTNRFFSGSDYEAGRDKSISRYVFPCLRKFWGLEQEENNTDIDTDVCDTFLSNGENVNKFKEQTL